MFSGRLRVFEPVEHVIYTLSELKRKARESEKAVSQHGTRITPRASCLT